MRLVLDTTGWIDLCTHQPNLVSLHRGLTWVVSCAIKMVSRLHECLKAASLGNRGDRWNAHSRDGGRGEEPPIVGVQLLGQLVAMSFL